MLKRREGIRSILYNLILEKQRLIFWKMRLLLLLSVHLHFHLEFNSQMSTSVTYLDVLTKLPSSEEINQSALRAKVFLGVSFVVLSGILSYLISYLAVLLIWLIWIIDKAYLYSYQYSRVCKGQGGLRTEDCTWFVGFSWTQSTVGIIS